MQIAMSTSFPNTGENIGGIYCEGESFRCQGERPLEDAVQRPHFIEKETAQPPILQAQTREMLIALYMQVLNKFKTRLETTSCTCVSETGPLLGSSLCSGKHGLLFLKSPGKYSSCPIINTHYQAGPACMAECRDPLEDTDRKRNGKQREIHQGTCSPDEVCALGTQISESYSCSGCIWAERPTLTSCCHGSPGREKRKPERTH